ncbi:MAG TPA: hypothetical protein PJ991_04495 [Kiritimatiellia bacterium]|nr:hypothetical protein [Kiritimatiellia bacterium]
MKLFQISTLLSVGLMVSSAPTFSDEKSDGPEVNHFPTLVGIRGQPIPIYAQVKQSLEPISEVNLYVADSPEDITTKTPMVSTRENHYQGSIPPLLFAEKDKIWYFIASTDTSTNLTQTRWYPVSIRNPDNPATEAEHIPVTGSAGSTGNPIPAGETTGISYGGFGYREGAILGGALVGGAIVAGAMGGSGGGSGFDDSNTVSVPASGGSSGGFSSAPQDRVIDGSGAIRGRTIKGVRVTVNYRAYTIPDRFQIIYNGSVIADSGVVSGNGSIQGVSRGTSPLVTIRVITPQGGTAWDWSATIEYSVVE